MDHPLSLYRGFFSIAACYFLFRCATPCESHDISRFFPASASSVLCDAPQDISPEFRDLAVPPIYHSLLRLGIVISHALVNMPY